MNKFILLLLFNFILCVLDEKQKKKYIEELKEVFKKLNIVPNDKQQIDQKSMAKVIKYVFGGLDKSGNSLPSTSVEDEFTFIIIKNLLQGKPDYINIEDIPDILDPKKLEDMTNEMFKNFKLDRVEQKLKMELEKRKSQAKTNKKPNKTPVNNSTTTKSNNDNKINERNNPQSAKDEKPEDKIEL